MYPIPYKGKLLQCTLSKTEKWIKSNKTEIGRSTVQSNKTEKGVSTVQSNKTEKGWSKLCNQKPV